MSNNVFHLKDDKIILDLVPERLRGEIASFDIKDASGKVIVEQGRRIAVRQIREIEKAKIKHLELPVDYLIGKILAKAIIDAETGKFC